MTNSTHIIFAFQLDGKGGATNLDNIELSGDAQQPIWIHMDASHPDSKADAQRLAKEIDEQSLNALFDENVRPRAFVIDDTALIAMRGVNSNEKAQPEDMVSIRLWVTNTHIVSVRSAKIKSIQDVRDQLVRGRGPKTVGDIVATLCLRLLERMEPAISDLNENIDNLEEHLIDRPDIQLRKGISDIRKQAILLRRYIAPQKEAITNLRNFDLSWMSAKNIRMLQESTDRVIRYIEDLDAIRERAQIVKDELANSLSDKLNRNLYLLSIITAIFLPLGFLTGLFGINVGGMPGAENPYAFTEFAISLTTLVVIQIIVFKWFKWF
ncbi:MAG: zinc transporter [Enterobacterales bacterium]|jgi:zinc transporter